MNQNSDKKKIIIIVAVIVIILIILLLILHFRNKDTNQSGGRYGEVPTSSETTTIGSNSDGSPEPVPAMPTLIDERDFTDPEVYPETVDYWEESLTGGGVPQKYTDGDGNSYTKKYFPSLGYCMYIPDGWTRIEHSDSYLQNIYYLVSDKEGYEDIQISIATKTATDGLSPAEVRNLFKTTHNNMEYNFRHGEYLFVTTMYESGPIHQITTADIPGFEELEDTQILVYYDEPEVTFLMDIEPTYYVEPYVINYYIIKENVAIMLTVIGPRKQAANMNYLLTAMGLNCKELYNENANAIHYSPDKQYSSPVMAISGPSDWTIRAGFDIVNYIKCSDDETNALFGTEILYSNSYINDETVTSPRSLLSNSAFTASVAYSCLEFNETIPGNVLINLNYSVKYSPENVKEIAVGTDVLTQIDFTCTLDETSLFHQLAIIENPVTARAYIKKTSKGYVFIVLKYNAVNSSYIESLAYDILSNTEWPE